MCKVCVEWSVEDGWWPGGMGRGEARRSFPVDAEADGADGLRADGARYFALEPLERALVVAEERLELVEAVLVVVLRGGRGGRVSARRAVQREREAEGGGGEERARETHLEPRLLLLREHALVDHARRDGDAGEALEAEPDRAIELALRLHVPDDERRLDAHAPLVRVVWTRVPASERKREQGRSESARERE